MPPRAHSISAARPAAPGTASFPFSRLVPRFRNRRRQQVLLALVIALLVVMGHVLLAEGTDAHPQLGKGMGGFGQYYWRGFVDKTDGNYWVIFVLPTILHQDERYFAMGEGGFWKRGTYAATRIFVARNYDGDNTFNVSEVLGRGIAQGISTTYYPHQSNAGEKLAVKYAYALGRDALTNVFREFWPDIATHVLHRHP